MNLGPITVYPLRCAMHGAVNIRSRRAGWAITLAGDRGKLLEDLLGPAVAGALIYTASGSHPVPNFQASNEEALADLRRRAARKETVQ